jgi:capsular exopolysaccharide synthesis family protein
MGLLAALGLGLGAALLAEQGDTSFRDPEGLTAALGLPVLATLPFVATGGGRDPGRRDARVVAMLDDPNGPLAEQYRILATKVLRQSQRRGSGMVLVTSPTGGEGKTTTAVNLALALSHLRGDRVLLVDTDLGRPAVHLLLGTYLDNGLAKLLAHPEDDPRGYVRHVHGLSVLQTGPFAQEVRAALASSRAQRAFRRLRQSYELVVVDSPPVLAVAEGLILERLVDSVLLVVRASSTPRQVVRRTVESLDPEKMIGAVLNAADTAVAPAYPYRYYEPEARSAVGGGGARP